MVPLPLMINRSANILRMRAGPSKFERMTSVAWSRLVSALLCSPSKPTTDSTASGNVPIASMKRAKDGASKISKRRIVSLGGGSGSPSTSLLTGSPGCPVAGCSRGFLSYG